MTSKFKENEILEKQYTDPFAVLFNEGDKIDLYKYDHYSGHTYKLEHTIHRKETHPDCLFMYQVSDAHGFYDKLEYEGLRQAYTGESAIGKYRNDWGFIDEWPELGSSRHGGHGGLSWKEWNRQRDALRHYELQKGR